MFTNCFLFLFSSFVFITAISQTAFELRIEMEVKRNWNGIGIERNWDFKQLTSKWNWEFEAFTSTHFLICQKISWNFRNGSKKREKKIACGAHEEVTLPHLNKYKPVLYNPLSFWGNSFQVSWSIWTFSETFLNLYERF